MSGHVLNGILNAQDKGPCVIIGQGKTVETWLVPLPSSVATLFKIIWKHRIAIYMEAIGFENKEEYLPGKIRLALFIMLLCLMFKT